MGEEVELARIGEVFALCDYYSSMPRERFERLMSSAIGVCSVKGQIEALVELEKREEITENLQGRIDKAILDATQRSRDAQMLFKLAHGTDERKERAIKRLVELGKTYFIHELYKDDKDLRQELIRCIRNAGNLGLAFHEQMFGLELNGGLRKEIESALEKCIDTWLENGDTESLERLRDMMKDQKGFQSVKDKLRTIPINSMVVQRYEDSSTVSRRPETKGLGTGKKLRKRRA